MDARPVSAAKAKVPERDRVGQEFDRLRDHTLAQIDELEARIHDEATGLAVKRAWGLKPYVAPPDERANVKAIERCEAELVVHRRVLTAIDDAEARERRQREAAAEKQRARDAVLAAEAAEKARKQAELETLLRESGERKRAEKALEVAWRFKGREAELPAHVIAELRATIELDGCASYYREIESFLAAVDALDPDGDA